MRMSLREIAMSKPMACSETSMELQPAALQTFIPNSSAAARSIRSTPTPVRQTTLVFLSCEMISLVKGTAPCMMMPSASRPISMTSASLVGRAITSSASISSRIGLMRSTGTSLLPKYLTRNLAIAFYAPNPKVLVGLSQRILRRDSAEILLLLLIAPTVLSGNLSMASLCG